MLDTFERIANDVRLRCPAADLLLARSWVNHSFRRIAERRHWSWMFKFGQFISPAVYNTGTVTCTTNLPTITGTNTNWDGTLIGRQFRAGIGAPIYTVLSVESATSLTLDAPWAFNSVANIGYLIYQAFFTVPPDFLTFQTVYDPRLNWQINLNNTQAELNSWDAQRAYVGNVYTVVARDYTTNYAGSVGLPVQIVGTGAVPVSSGAFSGPVNAIYTVQITGTGASGTATFQWKANNGAFSGNITTSSFAFTMAQGVNVYFPATGTYNNGDTFIIQCTAVPQVGLPRYELWPHFQGAYNWPFMYITRATDLEDVGAVLPRTIRGDVLMEMAMAEAANWPGPSPEKRNPYYNPVVQARHERKAENLIHELELQDDNIFEEDIKYSVWQNLPFAPSPLGDANFLQSHDVGWPGV